MGPLSSFLSIIVRTAVSFAIQLKVIVSCLVSAGGTFSHCLLYSAVRVNVPFASEEIMNLWNPGAPQRSDSLSNSEVMRSPQSDTRYQEYPVVGLDFSFQTYVEPASAVTVSEEFSVMGIGVYAVDEDEEAATVKEEVTRIAMSHGGVLEAHAFRLDKERITIRFDLIVDFSVDDREQVFDAVREEVAERYPGYSISAILDIDV